MQILLWTLITLYSIQNTKELPETADPYIVECNKTMTCTGDPVTDCTEVDAACIIDCSSGDEIYKDAEFMCHSNLDCTLICDSLNANKACLGTILNASQSSHISVNVLTRNSRACEYMIIDANSSDLYLNITVIGTFTGGSLGVGTLIQRLKGSNSDHAYYKERGCSSNEKEYSEQHKDGKKKTRSFGGLLSEDSVNDDGIKNKQQTKRKTVWLRMDGNKWNVIRI